MRHRREKVSWDVPRYDDDGEPGGLSGRFDDIPPYDPAWTETDLFKARLKSNTSLRGALVAGAIVGSIVLILWIAMAWLSESHAVFMALGMGYAIGYTILVVGKGEKMVFGLSAAALTLAFSIPGIIYSAAVIHALENDLAPLDYLSTMGQDEALFFLLESVSTFVFVIVLLAAYESFRIAVVRPPKPSLESADDVGHERTES